MSKESGDENAAMLAQLQAKNAIARANSAAAEAQFLAEKRALEKRRDDEAVRLQLRDAMREDESFSLLAAQRQAELDQLAREAPPARPDETYGIRSNPTAAVASVSQGSDTKKESNSKLRTTGSTSDQRPQISNSDISSSQLQHEQVISDHLLLPRSHVDSVGSKSGGVALPIFENPKFELPELSPRKKRRTRYRGSLNVIQLANRIYGDGIDSESQEVGPVGLTMVTMISLKKMI